MFQQYATVFYPHLVRPQRLIGRRRERLARSNAKVSSMPRTNDLTGFDFSTFQRLTVVGTAVLYGVKLRTTAYDE